VDGDFHNVMKEEDKKEPEGPVMMSSRARSLDGHWGNGKDQLGLDLAVLQTPKRRWPPDMPPTAQVPQQ
jgi:hypothetical protein